MPGTTDNTDPTDTTRIRWQDSAPVSLRFDDVYFSRENGLDESRYVFLTQNDLPERWSSLSENFAFTVVETGFGTGLNFLTTWHEWNSTRKKPQTLHYVSVEKYPLTKKELIRCLEPWEALSDLSEQLIARYPPLIQGPHQLEFEAGGIKLTLIFEDAYEGLNTLGFAADCWYLDGFAPSKNPSMWSDHLYQLMADRSNPHATFATFTAAGHVRRGLVSAGFTVTKHPGFGRKRDMLKGQLEINTKPTAASFYPQQFPGWWQTEALETPRLVSTSEAASPNDFDAIVIGAGLAGLTTAWTLAENGFSVGIIDQNQKAAKGSTNQKQLAMYAKLPRKTSQEARFALACLSYSRRFYDQLQEASTGPKFWHRTGLLQLAWNKDERKRQEALLANLALPDDVTSIVDAKSASRLSNLPLQCGGLWFPGNGWLAPSAMAETVLRHNRITPLLGLRVSKLIQHPSGKWLVYCADDRFTAQYAIVATAGEAIHFEQCKHLPTKPLRGQTSNMPSDSLRPSCVVCGEGYLCPAEGKSLHFGATYDLASESAEIKKTDDQKNLIQLQKWLGSNLRETIAGREMTSSSAGLRCTTPDYQPIVGPVPNHEAMIERFDKLKTNAKSCTDRLGAYYTGLFVNVGHGSKGVLTTPLAAQLIAALICKTPMPVTIETQTLLSPARFLIKDLIRNRI